MRDYIFNFFRIKYYWSFSSMVEERALYLTPRSLFNHVFISIFFIVCKYCTFFFIAEIQFCAKLLSFLRAQCLTLSVDIHKQNKQASGDVIDPISGYCII